MREAVSVGSGLPDIDVPLFADGCHPLHSAAFFLPLLFFILSPLFYLQRALFYASVGLAFVSMLKAAQKVREGNFGWMERSLTAANAGLIAAWVAQVDGLGQQTYLLVSQIAAFALSLYQLLSWWTSRQKEEHVDFPVAVILFVVVLAALASMKSTLSTADKAFQASGALADKVSAKR